VPRYRLARGALIGHRDGVPPSAGVVGLDGVMDVPPSEGDSPIVLPLPTPPVETDGPTGTLGAPGSDSVGESASGDGVTNDGTVSDGGVAPTAFVEGVEVSGVADGLPSGYVVLPDVAGAGVLAPDDVPTGAVVTVDEGAVPGGAPIPLPVTPTGAEPGACVGAVPSCASTTGA